MIFNRSRGNDNSCRLAEQTPDEVTYSDFGFDGCENGFQDRFPVFINAGQELHFLLGFLQFFITGSQQSDALFVAR